MATMAEPAAHGVPKRLVLVILCFLATTLCYIDRVNISVAVIPMADQFGWSQTTKGFVLSSFFIGYLLMMTPGGWLANRYGGRMVMGAALALWSLFTLLTPLAASLSFAALIATRILMGVGEAANFPAIIGLFARWLPKAERTRAVSLMFAGIPAGTVLGLSVSGLLVAAYGWQENFYVFGAIGIGFAALWFWLVHGSPDSHPTISPAERAQLAGIAAEHNEVPPVPWGDMLRKKAVWALIINHTTTTWLLYLMLTWMPSYFRDVQHLAIAKSGLFSAAPWLTAMITGPVIGHIADRWIASGASITRVRKTMQATAMIGVAAGMLLASRVTDANSALLVLCGTMAFYSFTSSGFACNHLDIAPRYAAALYGLTNTFATIPGIVGVAITGFLLDLTHSYTSTFLLAAGVAMVGAVTWLAWGTGERVID